MFITESLVLTSIWLCFHFHQHQHSLIHFFYFYFLSRALFWAPLRRGYEVVPLPGRSFPAISLLFGTVLVERPPVFFLGISIALRLPLPLYSLFSNTICFKLLFMLSMSCIIYSVLLVMSRNLLFSFRSRSWDFFLSNIFSIFFKFSSSFWLFDFKPTYEWLIDVDSSDRPPPLVNLLAVTLLLSSSFLLYLRLSSRAY